jgi:hypothetical protein
VCQDFFLNNFVKYSLRMLSFGVPDDADGARRGRPISLSTDALGPDLRRWETELFYLETRKPGKIHEISPKIPPRKPSRLCRASRSSHSFDSWLPD